MSNLSNEYNNNNNINKNINLDAAKFKQIQKSTTEPILNKTSSSAYLNESNNAQQQKTQQQQQKFSSNLCAVLNDPRKDRNKINYLFTKTWGSDFVDTTHVTPIHNLYLNYRNVKLAEFQDYLSKVKESQIKHNKNKLDLLNLSKALNKQLTNLSDPKAIELSIRQQDQKQSQLNDLEKIPKIFFDPNFSLTDKETFNIIISSKIFETAKTNNSNNHKNPFGSSTDNPFLNDNEKNPFLNDNVANNPFLSTKSDKNTKAPTKNPFLSPTAEKNPFVSDTQSYKNALEMLSVYLDITETQISKQISTKANTFFNAIHSQDEVQEHVFKTYTAVKKLRENVKHLDENVILRSISVIKLFNLKMRLVNLIEKFELMSSVYQTQPTIQLHLSSSEFTGALDLIAMSQDILRQDLRGIRSLRHYDSQFAEIEKAIDKILHQEFTKYIISDLSRDFSQGSSVLNQEKLYSLMLGILRIKTSNFIDLCKDEILIYLKSTVKQTVIEYISQLDDDSLNSNDDENNMSLNDRIKPLKMQEFLHLLSKVLANTKTMLGRILSLIKIIKNVVNSAAGLKDEPSDDELNQNQDENHEPILLSKELINKATHTKLISSLRELISNASDYAQERLNNLLEEKFKDTSLEKLNSNDFISLSNLIDQFILDFDLIANKKTSSLRSWIQNQANKFLHKFHMEKKEKLILSLDSERWKQSEIPNEIQMLVDHIVKNGLGSTMAKKNDQLTKPKTTGDYIMINDEKYLVFGSVIVLIKLMVDYCVFAIDMPNMSFDVSTRVIELFKIFNAKSYQMILGAGAVEQKTLKVITFKTLTLTYRCLEIVLVFLPIARDFFKEKLTDKQSNSEKQFNLLIKDYNEHKNELNNKLLFMIDDIFRDLLSNYEVIAPVPSQCFRSICQQILRIHEIASEIFNSTTLIQLFTDIHARFKQRLADRLKGLNVVNDGGPQHALIYSDMIYYIKQFKGLSGLHLISINFEDVWKM